MKLSFLQYILISFCLFISFIVFLVIKTFSVKNELVAEDYYNKELHYQDQINKMNQVTAGQDLNWQQTEDMLILKKQFIDAEQLKGSIEFYRPSDASLDLKFPIALTKEGTQSFPRPLFTKGLYKIKADWKLNGQSYYSEKDIYIQ